MTPLFRNRIEAGRALANRLSHLAGSPGLLVLGLPRGGVPVAGEVAAVLQAPLDVFVVRKLGVPGHEEFAMGAIASGGTMVIDQETVQNLGISPAIIERVAELEQAELERRERAYRSHRPYPDLTGSTIILVDDGVATGSTMLAALRAIRPHHPRRLIAAAPVMSDDAYTRLARLADACVTLATPSPFGGVGEWYLDFSQTSDAEVMQVLARHRDLPDTVGNGAEHAGVH